MGSRWAHRIGQKNEVRVLRLMTVNSVEERILAAAKYKLNMDEKVIQAGRFNNTSSGSERRQLLQSILRADDEDGDEDENETPDDEVVNQMIARSEKEFEDFQQMDIDRRRADAALGAERKPRLIEESELPAYLLEDPPEEESSDDEEKKALELGRGNRARKEGVYTNDAMSEKEWLKAIGAEDEEFEDDDDIPGADDGAKKKSGKKQKRKEESEDDEPKKKKKKSIFKRLQKQMRKLLEIVIQYEDQDGRILSDPFMKLPTRKELPDYYEVIRKPVDITKIMAKIDDGKYDDMDMMSRDFDLLCLNTQKYNEDGSLIHEDSIVLQSVFTNAREKLQTEFTNDQEEEDEESNHAPSVASTSNQKMEDDSEDVSLAVTPEKTKSSKKKKKEPKESSKKEKKESGKRKRKKKYSSDEEGDDDY